MRKLSFCMVGKGGPDVRRAQAVNPAGPTRLVVKICVGTADRTLRHTAGVTAAFAHPAPAAPS
jgi:hypothetical protein